MINKKKTQQLSEILKRERKVNRNRTMSSVYADGQIDTDTHTHTHIQRKREWNEHWTWYNERKLI